MRLHSWSAIPSGGAITVDGIDEATERAVKLRKVVRLESGEVPRFPFGRRLVVQAVMPDGARHTLA